MTLYEIPGDAEINRGLIGYFKLDDMKAGSAITTAVDRAGFEDGVITDGANADGVNGLNPDALDFNGTTSTVVSSSVPNVTEGSVSLWFKRDSAPATATNLINFDQSYLEIDFVSSKIRGVFYDTGTWKTTISTADVKQGVWQHVVMTWKENDYLKLYVDGEFDTKTAITTYQQGALTGTQIGWLAVADFFEGQVQNVRTYDRVLTASEVSKITRWKL